MLNSDTNNTNEQDSVRERAIGFFRLLRDFAQTRQSLVREVDEYPDHLWLHEIPTTHDCYTRAIGENEDHSDDVWLEIRHRTEPKCPSPPEIVIPWLKSQFPFGSGTEDEPELYDQIRVSLPDQEEDEKGSLFASEQPEYDQLENHHEVSDAWDEYLVEHWLLWTDLHQEWQRHHAVYARLFSIHQAQLREGERFELVLGLGCLVWITPSDQRVVRHLLTVPAVLEFDPNQGVFTVGPTQDGIKMSMELDMLEADERPAENLDRSLDVSFKSLEQDLWDRETLDAVLRSIVKSLDDRAEYDCDIGPVPRLAKAPRAMFAPALIFRRRSSRGMVATFTKIIEQIEDGSDIPPNIRKVSGTSDGTCGAERQHTETQTAPQTNGVYFPLPANREQYSIVDKLSSNTGLLVQGPPGTGKSHTIANLVCHLLATGKRVLVTAQTPQALLVLKDKIPKPLQALCVSVLGHDRKSVSQLEASVRGIANREATWDETLAREEIEASQQQLESLRSQCALVDRELENMRRAEVENQEIGEGTYTGTAKTVAQRIARNKPSFSWLTDDIRPDQDLPLQPPEFRELLAGLRKIDNLRAEELTLQWPTLSAWGMHDSELVDLIGKEQAYEKLRDDIRSSCQTTQYDVISQSGATRAQIQVLDSTLKDLREAIATVLHRKTLWCERAVTDVLSGAERPWKELHNITSNKIVGLAERARSLAEKHIEIPEGLDHVKLQADASDLKMHLEQGGKLGMFSSLLNATVKATKYIPSTITIEGRTCNKISSLATLLDWIDLQRTADFVWNMWKGTASRIEGPLPLQIASLEEHLESLQEVLSLERLLTDAQEAVGEIRGLHQPTWQDGDSREELFQSCRAVVASILTRDSRNAIARVESQLDSLSSRENAHPTCGTLLDAVEHRNQTDIRKILVEITALASDEDLLNQCKVSLDILAKIAPDLTNKLENTRADTEWDDRILVIQEAWRWAQARYWLNQFIAGQSVEELQRKYEMLAQQQSTTVEKLAATKAWSHCIDRLSESHRQNLVAWQQAIKRIGAGTGRHAERHRRAAQQHLASCLEAIPAWVMPMYRLYETIVPRPGMFDVVIVDEASQCGLDGLLLFYLGKQLVIVGDDEQISPTRITDHASFQYLVDQYLPEYHLKSVLQPETSLFDLGEVWFRDRIVLREHFRCMPEIIRFSNDLCYEQTPLIPLRQYPADRVVPVKAVHVVQGCVHGTGQRRNNPPEARALVDAIVACCDDPRYEKKTMGVISLLGDGQARLIENELIERLGPEEIEKRKLLCGNAYSFQGDERDVMFLSLVVASVNSAGDRSLPRAVTSKQFKQRFNVAASRACDQMWLFHSVSLEELRNPQDLRRRFVEYCKNPTRPAEEIRGINIEELRYLASQDERPRGSQPAPFDSWFEVDVFLKIHDRGYRVVPQFSTLIGNYRIDLVVEGDKPKLAIECDGDHWHGPDQFHKDMFRQRQLERAGWTFWRVRSSEYYAESDAVLESLWRRLKHLGIVPANGQASKQDDCPAFDEGLSEIDSRTGYKKEPVSEGVSVDAAGHTDEPVEQPPMPEDRRESTHMEGEQSIPDSQWRTRALKHPEESTLAEIAAALVEIIEADGPMVDYRAFKIYARAAGIQRIRRPVKDKLSRGLEKSLRDSFIERRRECGTVVVWRTGAPDVVVRPRGDRPLQEIPPSEIAQVMTEVIHRRPHLSDTELIDELRNKLAIGRVTTVARVFLSKVRQQLVSETD